MCLRDTQLFLEHETEHAARVAAAAIAHHRQAHGPIKTAGEEPSMKSPTKRGGKYNSCANRAADCA